MKHSSEGLLIPLLNTELLNHYYMFIYNQLQTSGASVEAQVRELSRIWK